MGVSTRSGPSEESHRALRWYLLLIISAFAIIVLRLVYLQLIQHDRHLKTSYDNVLRTASIPPPRGTIYDRSGQVLAISKQTYGLLFIPPPDLRLYMPDDELRRLLRITGRSYHYLRNEGDNENPAERKPHVVDDKKVEPPRLWEILESSRPAELMAALARLEAQLPAKSAVAEQLQVVWPYPHTVYAADDAWVFCAAPTYNEYAQLRDSLRDFLSSNDKLLTEYNNDCRRLVEYHLNDLLADSETSATQLGKGFYGTLRDSLLLARYYIDQQTLAQTDCAYLRLSRVVGLASYFSALNSLLDPPQQPDPQRSYEALMGRLDVERGKAYSHEPLKLIDELPPDQRLYIAEHIDQFQNFIIEQYSFQRQYKLGPGTAHLLGYIGAASEDQVANGYDQHERTGKAGIEREYEEKLRGAIGSREIEINRSGTYRTVTKLEPPARGTDLYLSIDAGLQAKANQQISIWGPGAVIVCSLQQENPGEILALTSGPTYDATRLREADYYSALQADPDRPELNRAVGQTFPPGSTFKLVTLAAALASGTTHWGDGYYCRGYMDVGNKRIAPQRRFWCHKRTGHGGLNVSHGLAESCDVAFWTMGLRMKHAGDPSVLLHDCAIQFGYGSPTGIDLPEEAKGTVPDREWKFKALDWTYRRTGSHSDQNWYDGDTLNYSIGQGFLQVTPLQVLMSASTIAWGGVRYRPHLLIATSAAHGQQREPVPAAESTELDPAILDLVKTAMRETVLTGTCRQLGEGALAKLEVCAKTGTAETGPHADHSWVVGFFPKDNPRYGFICFFEHGGHSGDAAIPAAKELLKWLQKNDPLARPQAAPSV